MLRNIICLKSKVKIQLYIDENIRSVVMPNPQISIYSKKDINRNYNVFNRPQNGQNNVASIFDDNYSDTNTDLNEIFSQKFSTDTPSTGQKNTPNISSNIKTLDLSKIKGDGRLPEQMLEYIKALNTGEHKNETIQIGKYWYRFGINGNVERIFNHKPKENINDSQDSFTYLTYNSNNDIDSILMYEKEGVKDKNGTRRCNYYNSNGEFYGYYIETNGKAEKEVKLNPEFNAMIDEVKNGKISMPELEQYLSETIYDVKVEQNDETRPQDNLVLFMQNYEYRTGESLLERLSRTDDGKELCRTIINGVIENNDGYKYIDDIVSDINSHPTDYRKLSVDVERILTRPDVYGENESLELNEKIDEPTTQGETGNCYLLSTVSALDSTEKGHRNLKSLWRYNENNDIEFTCKGNNKTYIITREQIQKSNHLSHGDDDMRIYEIAMDMYRRDMAYENRGFTVASDGGTMSEVMKAFFGIDYNSTVTNPDELLDADLTQKVYNFDIDLNGANLSVQNTKGETVPQGLINQHQYQVKEVHDGNIYFVNPWNNKNTLIMPFEQFKNLHPNIEVIDLSQLPEQ